MNLADVMSTQVSTVPDTASAEDAYALMQAQGFHHLVVVHEEKIVGVLSDRDLGGKKNAALRRDKRVAALMTGNIVTARPGTTVKEAAKLMRGNHIGCLPVVDGGALVGIVTTADLLELLAQGVKIKEPRDRRGKGRYVGPMPGAPRL